MRNAKHGPDGSTSSIAVGVGGRRRRWAVLAWCAAAWLAGCSAPDHGSAPENAPGHESGDRPVRLASFNIWELSAEKLDQVDAEGRGIHPQVARAAEILQRVRPDVVLINEIDYDPERDLARELIDRYLARPRAGLAPLDYPHVVYLPTNTGVQSGFDFDDDGEIGSPEDGWGFGRYPGQYGMALLSRLPVEHDAIRTFRLLRWRDMPGHLLPDGENGRPAWYSPEEAEAFRLSSKSHWDVPVRLGTDESSPLVHVLASHPTPPVFDGDEDRNGRRNHDEIRFWVDYLDAPPEGGWMVDDKGRSGGLEPDARFVVLGDLNSDPGRVEPVYGTPAIVRLLEHPRIHDPLPGPMSSPPEPGVSAPGMSAPGVSAAVPDSRAVETCNFGRIDYALPSANLRTVGSGVFLPAEGDSLRTLVEGENRASDHYLVWVDVALDGPAPAPPASRRP